MLSVMKQVVKKTGLYQPVRNWMAGRAQKRELAEWERSGHPMPPPHIIKQRALKQMADQFRLTVLVETGTFHGAMVQAMKGVFDRIYSIELSASLAQRAMDRFAGQDQIEIIQGDSGVELEALMSRIDQPALFWLDGHYSAGETARGEKDTPIFEELKHIYSAPNLGHVVMIDDARCFGAEPSYPTLEELSAFVDQCGLGRSVSVENDCIRILPKS
jgi:hypothetical protein